VGLKNNNLADTLVGHLYAGRLITNEKVILVDMKKKISEA